VAADLLYLAYLQKKYAMGVDMKYSQPKVSGITSQGYNGFSNIVQDHGSIE
jgi:hypothetical protein